jgi:hypothetical protein
MRIRRIEGQGVRISGLLAGDLRLLEQIGVHADCAGSPSAEERLLQDAVRELDDPGHEHLNDDWRECVLPELRTKFSKQLDVVRDDVATARSTSAKGGPRFEFVIPFDHVEAWYGALNQARLVMQERYGFPEFDSPSAILKLLQSPNLGPFLTSRFYVQLQAALLDLVMDRDG